LLAESWQSKDGGNHNNLECEPSLRSMQEP
jgi:hypothetical protein